ncbi:glycogen debranching enzyme N-terminal domain-containing protein, partial [Candidatus Bathyarchaeota archaeon]|nr:glycogen debranching enzyme N-terminal domain-containing protein [Candidatus Bathyarchaeota archaeon]
MEFNEICLKSKDLFSLEENLQKEWLIVNGIGGYASSTVLGINTRKYHGLLISALNPPGYRTMHLEKIDEDITINNQTYRFGANEFKDIIYPKGFRSLKEFSINPFPTFIYSNPSVEIKKNIFMPTKKNAVVLIYNITNKSSKMAKIKLFPLVNSRNFHKISNNNLKPLQ